LMYRFAPPPSLVPSSVSMLAVRGAAVAVPAAGAAQSSCHRGRERQGLRAEDFLNSFDRHQTFLRRRQL
jgi:hypothetical protein